MLSINCKNCDGRCCTSKNRKLFVILTPDELHNFEEFTETLTTKYGKLTVLKKDAEENCIFYDSDNNLCKTYENRPFECRTYPLQIHMYDKPGFKFDSKVCPKTDECLPEEIIQTRKEWLKLNLPQNWISAYSEID